MREIETLGGLATTFMFRKTVFIIFSDALSFLLHGLVRLEILGTLSFSSTCYTIVQSGY